MTSSVNIARSDRPQSLPNPCATSRKASSMVNTPAQAYSTYWNMLTLLRSPAASCRDAQMQADPLQSRQCSSLLNFFPRLGGGSKVGYPSCPDHTSRVGNPRARHVAHFDRGRLDELVCQGVREQHPRCILQDLCSTSAAPMGHRHSTSLVQNLHNRRNTSTKHKYPTNAPAVLHKDGIQSNPSALPRLRQCKTHALTL